MYKDDRFLCKALIPFFAFLVFCSLLVNVIRQGTSWFVLIHFSDSTAHAYHDQAVVGGVYNIFFIIIILLFYYYYFFFIFIYYIYYYFNFRLIFIIIIIYYYY